MPLTDSLIHLLHRRCTHRRQEASPALPVAALGTPRPERAGNAPREIRRGVLQRQQSARELPPDTVYVPPWLLGRSSTAWFEACFCTPASRGLPSSPLKHRESDPSGSRSRRTWLIPLSECHLRRILKSWIPHYNGGRPHMSLSPGIPNLPAIGSVRPQPSSRHRRGESYAVRSESILGGLHHEYSLVAAGP
jgi:hypothetical protein